MGMCVVLGVIVRRSSTFTESSAIPGHNRHGSNQQNVTTATRGFSGRTGS